jgi:hypothetical protein
LCLGGGGLGSDLFGTCQGEHPPIATSPSVA